MTERAQLPWLTLSYSDLITDRGFKFMFPDLADRRAGSRRLGLPQSMKLAETAAGKRPKTAAMIMDNTATSVATAKALKDKLLAQEGLQLVVDEVWTPPLIGRHAADPESAIGSPGSVAVHAQRRIRRQTCLEKINEFGLGQGKIPTVSFSITIAEPDMLQSVTPEAVQGIMTIVANWGCKGHEDLIAELKAKYKEPWMTQNVISTYGDMWLMKEALEKAGKADRIAVADAFRAMDGGTGQILSGRRIEVRRKRPARRRGRRDRTMAKRRPGDGISVGPRTGAAVLAQKNLITQSGRDLSCKRSRKAF